MKNPTPMMKSWEELKKQNPDSMIMFRVGDFYELLGEDAEKASKLLGLTITTRNDFPMAGFPHVALEANLRKLIEARCRVAICEQVK